MLQTQAAAGKPWRNRPRRANRAERRSHGPCHAPPPGGGGLPGTLSGPVFVAGLFLTVSFLITVIFGLSQLPVTLYCARATALICLLKMPCSIAPAAAPTGPPISAPPTASVPPTCGVTSTV